MAKRSKADLKHAIDLLWFHQIRRENAALFTEVKRLQDEIASHIYEVTELRAVSEKAKTAAETAAACVQKALADQTTLHTAGEDAHRQAQHAAEKITSLEDSLQDVQAKQTEAITYFNRDTDKLKADLARCQDEHKLELGQVWASIQQISTDLDNKGGMSGMADVQHRVDHIEDFLQEGQNDQSVSRIEDSVGEQYRGGYAEETDPLLPFEKNLVTSGRPLALDRNEVAEPMLTLGDANDRDESPEVEEIDLDENVTTLSYAKHWNGNLPNQDSLVMLPQHESHLTQADFVQPMKQGRFHSWDRYFTEGQALIGKHPRRRELDIVKNFLEGLYSTSQREQCEQWLDLNGWTWESVAGFGLSSTPSVPVHLDSIDLRAVNKGNETAEKQAEDDSTGDPASDVSTKQFKKVIKVSKGKPNVETRSSQRLREREQAAKDILKPQQVKKTKSSAMLACSQTAKNKTATPLRDARGRFIGRRSSSPVLAAHSLPTVIQQSTAEGQELVSRKRTKLEDHATFEKRPTKQQAIASLHAPEASTRMKPMEELPERPSTPSHQQNPSQGPERSVPRLVKRKRSFDRISEGEGWKKRRMIDADGLLPLPASLVPTIGKNEGRKRKGRRLPLPPPPEIPIMPTSDE